MSELAPFNFFLQIFVLCAIVALSAGYGHGGHGGGGGGGHGGSSYANNHLHAYGGHGGGHGDGHDDGHHHYVNNSLINYLP